MSLFLLHRRVLAKKALSLSGSGSPDLQGGLPAVGPPRPPPFGKAVFVGQKSGSTSVADAFSRLGYRTQHATDWSKMPCCAKVGARAACRVPRARAVPRTRGCRVARPTPNP